MYEVSDEIQEYISYDDYLKLVSVPSLTENEVDFFEM